MDQSQRTIPIVYLPIILKFYTEDTPDFFAATNEYIPYGMDENKISWKYTLLLRLIFVGK